MGHQQNWPYIINLGNSIIGVSVLAMPFCFKQCGVVLGILLLLTSAWLTQIACKLLMKAALTSKKRSYEYLALHTFGPGGKLLVELSIIGLLLGTCIAFHVIIGDLGPAIVSKFTGLENTSTLRTSLMVCLGLCVALPLGLLRSVESLSNISAISLGFYTIFIAEVFIVALPNIISGTWWDSINAWRPAGVFACLPIFALSLACQPQLFVMYDALPEPSLSRMNSIIGSAINMCTSAYLFVGFFGYIAFYDQNLSGDVLVSFKPGIFSDSIKFGFVLSIAVSFPLVIFPCRASLYTLFFAHKSGSHVIPDLHFKAITVCIVIGTLIIGILVPNIEFILGLTGATMGSLICFIFPAVMYINVMSHNKSTGKSVAQLVLFLGVTILLASTYTTLYSQDKGHIDEPIKPPVQDLEKEPIHIPKDADNILKDPEQEKALADKDKVEEAIRGKPTVKPPAKDDANVESKDQDEKKEIRQEPPIPHAPDEPDKDTAIADADHLKDGEASKDDKKADGEKSKKELQLEQEKEEDAKKQKDLIDTLEKQQEQQKQLIEEQKELINELKEHKKEHEIEKAIEKEEKAKEKQEKEREKQQKEQEELEKKQKEELEKQKAELEKQQLAIDAAKLANQQHQQQQQQQEQQNLEDLKQQVQQNIQGQQNVAQQPAGIQNVQKPVVDNAQQQVILNNAQQLVGNNAQQPVGNNAQQPVGNNAQQPVGNNAQQPIQQNIPFKNEPNLVQNNQGNPNIAQNVQAQNIPLQNVQQQNVQQQNIQQQNVQQQNAQQQNVQQQNVQQGQVGEEEHKVLANEVVNEILKDVGLQQKLQDGIKNAAGAG